MKQQIPLPNQFRQLQESQEKKVGARVSLKDLLTFKNLHLDRYQEIIERELKDNVFQPQRFSEAWISILYDSFSEDIVERHNPRILRKASEFFRDKLKDAFLIDLGGGWGAIMAQFARKFGVQTYIIVDLGDVHDPYSAQPIELECELLSEEEKTRTMTALRVSDDMLDFVARLPDNSANFVLNGIDWDIIRDNEYRSALISELARTTRHGGIVFGAGTDLVPYDSQFVSKSEGLRLELIGPETFVLEKK